MSNISDKNNVWILLVMREILCDNFFVCVTKRLQLKKGCEREKICDKKDEREKRDCHEQKNVDKKKLP